MGFKWAIPLAIVSIFAVIVVSGCTQPVGTISIDVSRESLTSDIACPFNITPIIHKIGEDYTCPKIYKPLLKNNTPVICPTELPLVVQVNDLEYISGQAAYNYTDIILADYFIRCRKGLDVGENPRYWYCEQFMFYYDYNNVDSTGRITSKSRFYPVIELDENQDIFSIKCESITIR